MRKRRKYLPSAFPASAYPLAGLKSKHSKPKTQKAFAQTINWGEASKSPHAQRIFMNTQAFIEAVTQMFAQVFCMNRKTNRLSAIAGRAKTRSGIFHSKSQHASARNQNREPHISQKANFLSCSIADTSIFSVKNLSHELPSGK